MKIGLFGGTFDPIHRGHLRSAEEVRETFGLDRVLFIPASKPPHKKGHMTPAEHRLAMVRLATASNPAFSVSTIEIRRPGISYSIDTLRAFARKSRGRDTYYFILGADAFREIDSWKDFKELFPLCHFIVTSRPGTRNSNPLRGASIAVRNLFCYDFRNGFYRHRSGTRLFFLKLTEIAISASDIRRRAREGRSIRYLVPPEVETYIGKKQLYRREAGEKLPSWRR